MQIKDIMTTTPRYIYPDTTVQEAAQLMQQLNCGSLMVGENDKLTGFITDRDITLGIIAEGKDASTPVSEVMSNRVLYCFEDQDAQWAAGNMRENEILRLVVVNRDKRLTGVVSHSDIANAVQEQHLEGQELGQKVAQLAAQTQKQQARNAA